MRITATKAASCIIGLAAIGAQTLYIRELLIPVAGSELSIAIVIANWLALSALGSFFGSRICRSRSRAPHLAFGLHQAVIAAYLPLSIIALRGVKTFFGVPSAEPLAIGTAFTAGLVICLPVAFSAGALYPLASSVLDSCSTPRPAGGRTAAGSIYIWESVGFLTGAPLVSYALIAGASTIAMAVAISSAISSSASICLFVHAKSSPLARFLATSLALFAICMGLNLLGPADAVQARTLRSQWPGQEVIESVNSRYGNLTVTRSAGQLTFYLSGVAVIVTPQPDVASLEDIVHITMNTHPDPKDILVIGGGVGGLIHEILKYPVRTVTYAELDDALIGLVRRHPTALTLSELSDSRVIIRQVDGRMLLGKRPHAYDIIITHLPPPSTLALNRLYTEEFFRLVQRSLKDLGVLGFTLPGSLTYIGEDLRGLNASVLKAAERHLDVSVVPGQATIYLCSKETVMLNAGAIIDRLSRRAVETKTFSQGYLEERLDPQWVAWFKSRLASSVRDGPNKDTLPLGVFYTMWHEGSLQSRQMGSAFRALKRIDPLWFPLSLGTICLLAFALVLKARRPRIAAASYAMTTTGAYSMGMTMLVIYAYQVFYGLVYHQVALIIAVVMAGMSGGASIGSKMSGRSDRLMRVTESGQLATAALLTGLSAAGPAVGTALMPLALFAIAGLSGFWSGLQFTAACNVCGAQEDKKPEGYLYGMDLAGSWAFALVAPMVLMPLAGALGTGIMIMLMKTASLMTWITASRLPGRAP